MTHSTKPVSPLRQRMIDDMTLRKLNPKNQSAYLRSVGGLGSSLRITHSDHEGGDERPLGVGKRRL